MDATEEAVYNSLLRARHDGQRADSARAAVGLVQEMTRSRYLISTVYWPLRRALSRL